MRTVKVEEGIPLRHRRATFRRRSLRTRTACNAVAYMDDRETPEPAVEASFGERPRAGVEVHAPGREPVFCRPQHKRPYEMS